MKNKEIFSLLALAFIALTSVLLILKTNATINRANEWQLKKEQTVVSCGIDWFEFSRDNESRRHSREGKLPAGDHNGNGCPHPSNGTLCRSNETKKRHHFPNII